MDKFKELLKIIVIAGFGFGAILLAIVGLAAMGFLDHWVAQTSPEHLTDSIVGRAITVWLLCLPFALASIMMVPSRLKDLCLWAPFYAPLAALAGVTLSLIFSA